MASRAWVVRPWPHNIYRLQEFLTNDMVAIGWPAVGDLTGLTREQIAEKLKEQYDYNPRQLAQIASIVDRFVNQIKEGDIVAIPDGDKVYFGVVKSKYTFKPDLATDEEGYPHWIKIKYLFNKRPIPRSELPAALHDALKGRQSVFELPADLVKNVVENPDNYMSCTMDSTTRDQELKARYIELLSSGRLPGINSPSFEEAVRKVLSFYYPGLRKLPTTNAPPGADTDLITTLPGDQVVRIQVKCYRDDRGELSETAVMQLRNSMQSGDRGIIVTTTRRVSEAAKNLAASDPARPIGFIDGAEFAELIFENIDRFSDEELCALGLKQGRVLEIR